MTNVKIDLREIKLCEDSRKKRLHEDWIDNVKIFACIFVVLAHCFQGLSKADIIHENSFYNWFEKITNYFPVQLFFICSGYLYQENSTVSDLKEWSQNIKKKFLVLGVPYFTFTSITLVLKKIFQSSVNNSEKNILYTLFKNPTSPYWYLYVLFFIFMITPTVKSGVTIYIFTVISLLFKILSISNLLYSSMPYAINGVLGNEIWFVFGMGMAYLHGGIHFKRNISIICNVIFLIITILVCKFNISIIGENLILECLACFSVIGIIYTTFNKKIKSPIFCQLRNYTLPIYVMHTIFAAGFRTVVIKMGILNSVFHICFGIIISFLGPILATKFMEKTKYLEALIYPEKFIKL